MDLIQGKIDKFNKKAATDEKLAKELEGVVRKVQFDIGDDVVYKCILQNSRINDLQVGSFDDPDMRVVSDMDTLTLVLKGEMSPMKAWATKKIRIKASIDDMLRLRKFFS